MSTPSTTERAQRLPVRRPPARLRRADRRDQLLDCAAELLVEGGVPAVTMEGVAAQAGVSKALPYAHFDNAGDLLRGLRDRELDRLGERLAKAVEGAPDLEATIRAAVHAYFETIRERGAVLVAALRGLPMDAHETSAGENPAFFTEVLRAHLELPLTAAQVASAVFVKGIDGAVDEWIAGRASQTEAEDLYVRLVLGGAEAVTGWSGPR